MNFVLLLNAFFLLDMSRRQENPFASCITRAVGNWPKEENSVCVRPSWCSTSLEGNTYIILGQLQSAPICKYLVVNGFNQKNDSLS